MRFSAAGLPGRYLGNNICGKECKWNARCEESESQSENLKFYFWLKNKLEILFTFIHFLCYNNI